MIAGLANGVIGTNLVFGNANRKRSLEFLDDDWSPTPGTTENSPVVHQAGDPTGAAAAAAGTEWDGEWRREQEGGEAAEKVIELYI